MGAGGDDAEVTMLEGEDEELPLEIEDYSCNTYFEEVVGDIERYLVNEFRTRPELQQFLVNPVDRHHSQPTDRSNLSMVFGRNFIVGCKRGQGEGCTSQDDNEGIAVEIHVCDTQQQQQRKMWHPIARLFALPIFFLARGTTTASSYHVSESSYYLSLLTTAVARVMRGPFSLRFKSDPSFNTSPFFYADGTAPCFVSVGDHYQLAFTGVSPASMLGVAAKSEREEWTLQRVISQPVVKYRFQCNAYVSPQEWCQNVSDYLDMFQLQIGPQSRVRRDVFDGICVSLQRTFRLTVPRRFQLDHAQSQVSHTDGRAGTTLVWRDVLELENETMLLSAGPTTFPFGTGTAPLQGVDFSFHWSQLHDMEVHEDGKRSSNLNPFEPDEKILRNKLTLRAVAHPKKECELSHTACRGISEHVYMVMEHISSGEKLRLPQRMPATLTIIADEIVYNHSVSVCKQATLIDRLTKHQVEGEPVKADIRNVYFPGTILCRFAYMCANRIEVADVRALWNLVVDRLTILLEGGGERRHSLRQLIESIGLPAVEEINHGMPLLVQKLQLVSYCAKRMLCENAPTSAKSSVDGWEDETDDAASHSRGEVSAGPCETMGIGVASPRKRLITNGEPLVEPQALPIPPCTSDVLLLKAQELQNLGTASAGQQTRALIQSEGLFNDMCLFLYANRAHEGRVVRFPDFIQWYSPRDFVSPTVKKKKRNSRDHNNKNDDDDDDDDTYLSERMRRHSDNGSANVWWPLWSQAKPRPPAEIITRSFVPHEQARLVLRWMEKDLTDTDLLLETVHANFSNAVHRMLSHRSIEGNPAMAAYARRKGDAIAACLKNAVQTEGVFPGVESLTTTYSIAMRHVGEIETCLCAALAIERVLCPSSAGHDSAQQPSPEPAGETCKTLAQLVTALASPSEVEEDPAGLVLRDTTVLWDVWHRDGISQRFSADSRKPVAMLLRATCMAERPLNTAACFQQMVAETDETGVFRVALALAEEVL
ncbi:kinesin [Trypanosoma grayi]|uniref:kinesin n=1 Tax=Trypanosoma grayi TaxID=71804 RepID=UPI0004F43A66|nr:kinesin [Trypanosoma grayi]KEG10424.1 kinesin [Trypanosoma grayi]